MGNGHDTVFLARRVGPRGRVFGFDIQPAALDKARGYLVEQALSGQVELILDGHQHINRHLPTEAHGRITAAMFNLGYLPGSNKQTITRPDTTLLAIQNTAQLLVSSGIISILTYRGHTGGAEESRAVAQLLEVMSMQHYSLECIDSPGPILFLLTKTRLS